LHRGGTLRKQDAGAQGQGGIGGKPANLPANAVWAGKHVGQARFLILDTRFSNMNILTMENFLLIFLLEDGETVHNAFFDRSFQEES
jgi:hypothetical protein